MPTNTIENTVKSVDTTKYIPSSSDKKRAIMMYLFFGIMVSISKKTLNNFEYYHLKQASGRWIIFLLILVFDVVLLFIPVIKYLGLIPLIVLLVALVISAKQARDGKYFLDKKDSPLALFSWVGGWFIDLFEIGVNTTKVDEDSISDLPYENQANTPDDNSSKLDIEIDLKDQSK